MRGSSVATPSPLAAEMAMTRLWPAAAASSFRSSSFFAATSGLSSLLRTTTCGLSASSAEKSWSSVFTDPQVAHRVGRRAVDDVRDEPAALNVAEEGAAEADALVGALEEPRDVGEDHAVARRARLLARVPDAEVGRDGGERA